MAMTLCRLLSIATLMVLAVAGCVAEPPPEPVKGPYLRGVNTMTFLWFEGYEDQAGNESPASYEFLARHGMATVRLPISWERIQPQLGGELAPVEVARLRTEIARAHQAGLGVIVDLHAGCRHRGPDGATKICGTGISAEQFSDVWTRLSPVLRNDPGVVAYDIMNEPHDLVGDENGRADAEIWEEFSQAAVDALRGAGDRHRLMIEGVSWSNVDTFGTLHPTPWITDPLDNVVYSAHQYFEQAGRYTVSGDDVPQWRYSFWAKRFESDGTTGGRPFDEWNLQRLEHFVDWLAHHQVRGDIGEVGWPSHQEMVAAGIPAAEAADETRQWNSLADRWFAIADAAYLSVTYFAASGLQFIEFPGSPPGLPEANAVFVHSGGNGELRDASGQLLLDANGDVQPRVVDTANSQYDVLSKHLSRTDLPVD
ncbi:glycoside hydrolase family 5 protein [Mycobacterium deserti]|uniref:cellulase n=1 Tax=Mycobacterium deserti TaxID=2978347 RepID=A0ABT2M811_9MYCO|nr:glycoside hydrolase family 5 protein [Mycobacterium deserti]MCT7658403.1 glycoside hydrolase family 5 protein [Mycobacterium deserti]